MTSVSSRYLRVSLVLAISIVGLGSLISCSALDVNNPTRLEVEDVQNAVGVDYAMQGIRDQLATTALGTAIYHTGLFSDEFFVEANPTASIGYEGASDLRENTTYENLLVTAYASGYGGLYGAWQALWVNASVAMTLVRSNASAAQKQVALGELFAMRGYAMLSLAEQICPGFPVRGVDASNIKEIIPTYGGKPLTTDSAFLRAVAEFDSALVYAVDSARVLNFARVGKARALLGLGRFSDAGAIAQEVSDEYTAQGVNRFVLFPPFNGGNAFVGEKEGGNGLDFVSAADPRVTLVQARKAYTGDTSVMFYVPEKFKDNLFPSIVFASAIEARLIQAEAQLQPAENPSGSWLTTLNALRATVGLADTTDPGTASGRIDLLFRERALWLFATAHRLGDLRRLVSRYGRSAESVFPTGPNRVGIPYGNSTSLPFPGPIEHRYNAAIIGCTSR